MLSFTSDADVEGGVANRISQTMKQLRRNHGESDPSLIVERALLTKSKY
jgi:hypothetical protein